MLINKKQLEIALERVRPGLAGANSYIDQATSFAFMNGKVVTFNGEISVSHPIQGEGEMITGAVPSENLYKLLSKIKTKDGDDDIDISIVGNELIVTKGKMKAGFAIENEIKLPLDTSVSEVGDWKPLPSNFVKYVSMASNNCSKDELRFVLMCVHVTEEGFVEASDSFSVIKCELNDKMPFPNFLFPSNSAKEVVKIKPVKIATGKGWVHFQNEEGTIISCRVIADKFPDILALLKVEGTEITFPDKITEIVERAVIFAKRDAEINEELDISIKEKTLTVSTKSETDWFKEEMRINTSVEVAFKVSPYLLKRVLDGTKVCTVSENRLRFQGEGFTYVAALRAV